MSKYYNSQKTKNLFNPDSEKPFVISRSGIDLYANCPRCFYFDKRMGTGRPPGFPFTLNTAVDTLLKKEFDTHRAKGSTHPLMKAYGIKAVPFQHANIDEWRDARTRGIKFFHEPTNLLVRGGIDDIWENTKGELHIVDYKATSKNEEVSLDADWQDGYKRQMEVYQWLFRKNGFKISDTGYFVYCNGKTDKKAFDAKLEFNITVIPYKGKVDWVEPTVKNIKKCLMASKPPKQNEDCDYCRYRDAIQKHENR